MKKIIIFMCLVTITTSLLTSCGFFLNPTESSIEDEIYTEYETMMDAFVEIESITDISDYLLFWAQTLGIQAQEDRSQNVIIETPGFDPNQEDIFITLECGISLGNMAEDLRAVALSMVLIKEMNGSKPFRVIFAPYEGQDYYGAKNLPAFYLKNTQMIQLNTNDPNDVLIQGAASNIASIERIIKMKNPTYKMSYQVTINGFKEDLPFNELSEIPNAIKELGGLFATCKSKGMLFEIAGFEGSGSREFAPVSASAIMVINQNDIKSLEYSYGKMEDKLKKEYEDMNPDLLVTLSAIELPISVLSTEDTDHLVSFIYTIFNGFCGENENTFSSLNQVDITNNKFSSSLLILNQIDTSTVTENDDLNVICNLNNMNYKISEIHKGWYQNPDSIFVKNFLKIADKKPKGTFLESPLVEYQVKNKEMEMLSYGVDLKDCERQLSVLKNYIESDSII